MRRGAAQEVAGDEHGREPQADAEHRGPEAQDHGLAEDLEHDVGLLRAHGLFQADLAGARGHRTHHAVPDAEAAEHQGGADGEVDEQLHPPDDGDDALELVPGHVDLEVADGLVALHQRGDGPGHHGHVVPGLAAHEQAVRPDSVLGVAVHGRGQGHEGVALAVPDLEAVHHPGDEVEVRADGQIGAEHRLHAAQGFGQGLAQGADPFAVLDVLGREEGSGRGFQVVGAPVVGVHGMHRELDVGLIVQDGQPLDFLGRGAQHGHARQAPDGLLGFGREGLRPGSGVRVLLQADLDERDPAQEVQVAVEVLLDLVAHGQDRDEPGDAQADGQDHAEVASFLPEDLADAEDEDVFRRDHACFRLAARVRRCCPGCGTPRSGRPAKPRRSC